MRLIGFDASPSLIAANIFFGGRNVVIERGAGINRRCFVDASARVTFGEDCSVGPEVMIVTGSHRPGRPQRRAGVRYAEEVVIGKGAWIGARVTILPGVTIGDGAIIASGSVVTKDCDADTLYAGVPAERKVALSR